MLERLRQLFDLDRVTTSSMQENRHLQMVLLLLGYMLVAGGVFFALSFIWPVINALVHLSASFILGFILAYALNPLLLGMQRHFHLSREGAVIISTVSVLSVAGLGLFFVMLMLFQQVYVLILNADEFPALFEQRTTELRQSLDPEVLMPSIFLEDEDKAAEVQEATDGELPADALSADDAGTTPTAGLEPPVATSTATPTPIPIPTPTAEPSPVATPAKTPPPPPTPLVSSRLTHADLVMMAAGLQPGIDAAPTSTVAAARLTPYDTLSWGAASGGAKFAAYMAMLAFNSLKWLLTSVAFIGFTLVVTFFMLLDFQGLCRNFWMLVPFGWRDRTADIMGRMDYALGGYLRGQLMVCAIIAVLWSLYLMLIGLGEYALLLGFIAGVMNLIPYLGAVTALSTGVIYVILASSGSSILTGLLLVILGFGMLQAIESMVLQPLLVGPRAQLGPLTIIFALLLGASFGIAGMLLAVPVAAVLRVLVVELAWKPWEKSQRQQMAAAGEPPDGDIAEGALRRIEQVQRELRVMAAPATPMAAIAGEATERREAATGGDEPTGTNGDPTPPAPKTAPRKQRRRR